MNNYMTKSDIAIATLMGLVLLFAYVIVGNLEMM